MRYKEDYGRKQVEIVEQNRDAWKGRAHKAEEDTNELLRVTNEVILGLKEIIANYELLIQEACEELEAHSPNAPVLDKLHTHLEKAR